jgi:hypothetical protein
MTGASAQECSGSNSVDQNTPNSNSSSGAVKNALHVTEIKSPSELEELMSPQVVTDEYQSQIPESSTAAIVYSDNPLFIQDSETNPRPNEIELFNAEADGEEGAGKSRFSWYSKVVLLGWQYAYNKE